MRFHMPLTRSVHVSTGWLGASLYATIWLMLASVWLTVKLLQLLVLGTVWLIQLARGGTR